MNLALSPLIPAEKAQKDYGNKLISRILGYDEHEDLRWDEDANLLIYAIECFEWGYDAQFDMRGSYLTFTNYPKYLGGITLPVAKHNKMLLLWLGCVQLAEHIRDGHIPAIEHRTIELPPLHGRRTPQDQPMSEIIPVILNTKLTITGMPTDCGFRKLPDGGYSVVCANIKGHYKEWGVSYDYSWQNPKLFFIDRFAPDELKAAAMAIGKAIEEYESFDKLEQG